MHCTVYHEDMQLTKQRSFRAGFTLIELVIVISIIAVLSGFIVANYSSFTEEKKLVEVATQVSGIMMQARSRATTGDLGPYPCEPFEGYQVSYESSTPNEYEMRICCNATCTTAEPSASYIISRYELPANIEFVDTVDHESILESFSIRFNPFADGTSLQEADDPENMTVVLKNRFVNKCNWVTVSPLGVIETGKLFSC